MTTRRPAGLRDVALRLSVRTAVPVLGLAVALAGCGKPPTFDELMGNKPPVDTQTPVVKQGDALPPPTDPQFPQAAPQKTNPAEVIAYFKRLPTHEIENRHLQDLAALESGIEALDVIKATNSKLTDEGVRLVSKFTGLKELRLGGTNVTDASLAEIGKVTQLEALELDRTKITDPGLDFLKDLVNLKELSLASTQITDAGFPAFKNMTSLEVLKIGSTAVNGKGFDVFHDQGLRCSLREISADHTGFGTFGFLSIKGMGKLEKLSVGASATTDNALRGIKLPNLKFLELGYNSLSDQGVMHLSALKRIEHLGLRNNMYVTNQSILAAFGKSHKQLAMLDLEATGCSPSLVQPMKKFNKDLEIVVNGTKY